MSKDRLMHAKNSLNFNNNDNCMLPLCPIFMVVGLEYDVGVLLCLEIQQWKLPKNTTEGDRPRTIFQLQIFKELIMVHDGGVDLNDAEKNWHEMEIM